MTKQIWLQFLQLARAARRGTLERAAWLDWRTQISELEEFLIRSCWVRQVSWPILTVEYFNSLAKLIPPKTRVVEVCAGPPKRRILAGQMRARGLSWDATDLCEGHDAFFLDYSKYDMVFASWIPYTSRIDLHLAALNKPLILLGELGGCTGSEDMVDAVSGRISQLPEDFSDVLCFPYVYDSTYLIGFD